MPALTMFLLVQRANTKRDTTSCTTNELQTTLNTCDVHDDVSDRNADDLHSGTPYVLFDCRLPLITSVVFKLCSAVSLGSVDTLSYHVLMFNLTKIFMYQSTKVSNFF